MINLTDDNFEKEIQNSPKPVLVDFFADWCVPCSVLSPILEKLEKELNEKFILAKVNLNEAPVAAGKFNVERIPMVIFFNQGKPIQGFTGLRPEPIIREWLEKMLNSQNKNSGTEQDEEEMKIKELIKEYEEYAENNGLALNSSKEIVRRLARGLLENEKKYGADQAVVQRLRQGIHGAQLFHP